MRSALVLASLLVTAFSTDAAARPRDGGYFALGVGYGAASGDRGIALKPGQVVFVPNPDEWTRTDFGSGLSVDLRFGWLIGPIAPEISLFGHGSFDAENGAAMPTFQLRFHPLALADSLDDFPVDVSLFFGVGYAIGGYHHEGSDDGKGWDGLALTFGLGATYELSPKIHLGFDLKFALPQYSTWIFDYDDDETYEPTSTPSTLVIAPALTLFASF